jgi:phosphoglycolate phosphatase
MSPYDTYIFDLDGTLLNTLTDLTAAVNHAMNVCGMPPHTHDQVRQFLGNGMAALITLAVPNGRQNPCFEQAQQAFRSYYLEHQFDHTGPYEGIPQVLAMLRKRGRHLAVVSNKFHAATSELCRHYFPDTIEVAIGEHEAEGIRRKPAPDTVIEAMRQLGVDKERAVYVGDSDVDILTARNAGLPCISVLWGFRDRQFLQQHGATLMAERPEDLLRMDSGL